MTTKSLTTMNQYLLALLLLFLYNFTIAQNTDCIQFENLDPNTEYGSNTGYAPGDIFYEEQGIPVSLKNFYYEDGTTGFWNVNVSDGLFNDFVGASGQRLFISNINLHFDFAEAGNIMSEVCFAFYDGGGEENLAINGSDPLVVNDLSDLPSEINGVAISINYSTTNANTGELCLSGEIQTLTIGGQEFEFDALCFSSLEDCIISDIIVEPNDCTPNGIFYVDVEIQHQNEGTQGYKIFGNGQVYGNFDYEEQFVTIGPFVGNGAVYELIVEDNEFPGCQAITDFQSLICDPNCQINKLEAYTIGCSEESGNVIVDFEIDANTLVQDFVLYINDNFVGEFAVSDLPIYLPEVNFDTNETIVQVCLNSSNCCASVPLNVQPNCNDCITFEELTPGDTFGEQAGNIPGDTLVSNEQASVVLQPYIYEDGTTGFVTLFVEQDNTFPSSNNSVMVFPSNINMEVNFAPANPEVETICFEFYDLGGSINLGANGEVIFAEDYSELDGQEIANGVFVEVFQDENFDFPAGTVCLSGSINQITIGGQEMLIDNICYNYIDESCEISELLVNTLDCENDSFMVELSFVIDDSTVTNFEVLQNGQSLGSFDFTPTPTLLGPFSGDGTTQYEFTVITENCSKTYQLGGIDCEDEDCRIENIAAYIYGCTEDGQQLLWLDFDVINAVTPFFYVDVNDEFVGEYTFSEFPIILDNITPVIINGVEGFQVFVSNSNSPTPCVSEIFVEAIDCGDGDCIGYDYLLSENILEEFGPEPYTFFYEENNVAHYTGEVITPGAAFGIFSKNKAQYPDFLEAYGRFLSLLNHRVKLEFPAGSSNVTFDWFTTNDVTLIQVNDNEEVLVDFNLGLPSYDLGDISLEVEYIDANLGVGSATIIGQVETLVIGGVNLGIDNVCFESLNCEISNITKTVECDPITNTYDIEINFDFENTSNQFLLTIPGAGISNVYSYNDLPISLTGLTYMSNTDQILIADLNGNPNGPYCSASIDFEIPCMPSCSISEYDINYIECIPGTTAYEISFDLIHDNTGDLFTLYSPISGYEGTFSYDDLPLTVDLPITSVGFDQLQICDATNLDCCIEFEYDVACGCSINDLVVEPYCNDNGMVNVDIDFNYPAGISDNFKVLSLNGAIIGTYSLDQLPLTIEDFPASGGITNALQVCLEDAPNCCAIAQYEWPDCGSDCVLYDLLYEIQTCEDGVFYLHLIVNGENLGTDGFSVFGNGNNYGSFDYGGTHIELGPFAGDGQTIYEFIVKDNQFEDCQSDYIELGPIDCSEDCSISDLVVEAYCNDNNVLLLDIDFNVNNPGNDFFEVYDLNGNNLGYYLIADLPVTIDNYPANGANGGAVEVCINDVPNCCTVTDFELPDCNNDCEINDFQILTVECLPSGQYLAEFTFDYPEIGVPFTIFSEYSNAQASFDYLGGNVVYTIEFPSLDIGTDLLFLCNNLTDCCFEFELDIPCENDCSISDLAIEAYCNDNGGINLEINFNYSNPGNDLFDVIGLTGNIIGTFPLGSLPITIENYQASGLANALQVCINDNPNCCKTADFALPDCTDECSIDLTSVEIYDCEDGVFYIGIVVQAENSSPDGFSVVGNGVNYGDFDYGFITIGPLQGDGQTIYEFVLQDNSQPDCQLTFELDEVVDCESDCEIQGLVVEAYCNEEGEINVDIDFEYSGTSTNDFFSVYTYDGDFIASFPIAALPVTIEDYPIDPNDNFATLTICIDNNNNCCISKDFEIPNCSNDCNIQNVIAEAHDCDGDEFLIDVEVNAQNPGPLGYFIFINNEIAGPFNYSSAFVTVGPFSGDGTTVYNILVIDISDPSCFGSTEIGPIDCDPNACQISDLFAEASECDEEGLFTIDLTFDYNNVGDDGFSVVGNGTNYGTFEYAELPLTFGPFEGNPDMIYEFAVFDNDNPSCGGIIELGPITCPEPCALSNPDYQIACGDDSFDITIDFDHENTGEKFVIEGITGGFFFYDDLPITLTIPLANYNPEVFIVDYDDPDCALFFDVEVACCGIFELEADLGSCEEDGGLYAEITFDALNTQDSFLISYGNENGELESDLFAYADLPITVGPIYPNPSDELLFQVIDESLFCSAQMTMEAPYCNNASCVEFEMIDGFVFGPNLGYENGDLIGIEDEVKINYLLDDPNCENCNVFILQASTYPQFENASGQITALMGGGISLDFSEVNETVQQLSLDFFELGTWTSIQVNGGLMVEVNHLSDLPIDIAPGVQVEVNLYPNDPDGGSLIFTGEIEEINIYSNFLLLDNACFEAMETPDFCMDFEVLDPITDEVVLANSDDLGQIVYEEDGVKVSAEPMVFQDGSMPFETILLTPTEICDPSFINATDNRLFLGGAMKLDFSEFEVLPDYVKFDIAECFGTDGINIGINGEDRYIGLLEDLPSNLAPNVTLTLIPSNNVVSQATIILEGDITELIIGGWPVRVDNICYNGVPEDEDVWPGDANSDNIARHFDLLNIGIAYGEEGPSRVEDATEWNSFPADNWNDFFANGTNYKHADCNGDGVVNELDREAIVQNYNLTHGPVEDFIELPGTDTDPPILVDFPDGSQISSGTVFEVPVIFGTEEHPVNDIYGVAFTVDFDPTIFDPSSLTVEYPVSWFGEPDVNTLHVHKIYDEGKIEIALTRIDQNEVSGFGPIVFIRGIIDDIVGITNDVEVRIDGVLAADVDEARIPTQNITELVPVALNPIVKGDTKLEPFVFPNPTDDVVNIRVNQDYEIQSIEIFNSQSHLVSTQQGHTEQISLEELANGVYTLKIKVEGRVFYKRIIKI